MLESCSPIVLLSDTCRWKGDVKCKSANFVYSSSSSGMVRAEYAFSEDKERGKRVELETV